MIDPLFSSAALLFTGMFLFLSGVHKIREKKVFHAALMAYKILPDWSLRGVKYTLPTMELLSAVALLTPITRTLGIAMSALLLCIYGVAMAINLVRGRTEIECGCSFHKAGTPLSYWLLLRNALLLLIALTPLLPLNDRGVTGLDHFNSVIGAVTVGVLYLSIEHLMANHAYRITGEN